MDKNRDLMLKILYNDKQSYKAYYTYHILQNINLFFLQCANTLRDVINHYSDEWNHTQTIKKK